MSRLILLNGAPATGKSTLARRYAADHALCLVLDIDDLRSLLGRWEEDPDAAGRIARRHAVLLAEDHLTSGRDVVVPQLLARSEFIETLAEVADHTGADFHEVVLTAPTDVLLERLARRTARPERPADRDAATLLERVGAETAVRDYAERIAELARTRPRTVVIDTEPGLEGAWRALCAHVG